MAELRDRAIAVVLCSAEAPSLDALVAPGHGARMLRTADDEALFVCQPAVATDVVREIADRIAALDGDAVVLDVTDGWAAWSLVGNDAAHARSYLSQLDAPPDSRFVKATSRTSQPGAGRARWPDVLVPAYWREHLRERAARDAPVIA